MKRYKNNRILIFGDEHSPFQHSDTIPFLKAVKAIVEPDRVVGLGDSDDSYCFSRYPKDPEQISTSREIKGTRKYHQELKELFPELLLCRSNHSDRLWERAKVAGIPKGLIIPYLEMIGCNHGGWKVERDFTLTIDKTREQVLFAHHRKKEIMEVALLHGVNAVQGHLHTRADIKWIQLENRLVFSIQNPCLIGFDDYAFAYNRNQSYRPIRGCSAIIDGEPYMFIMRLKKGGGWTGKIANFKV